MYGYVLVAAIGLLGISGIIFNDEGGQLLAEFSSGRIAMVFATIFATILTLVKMRSENIVSSIESKRLQDKIESLHLLIVQSKKYTMSIDERLRMLIEDADKDVSELNPAGDQNLERRSSGALEEMRKEAIVFGLRKDIEALKNLLSLDI